jgi:hypothetical protein
VACPAGKFAAASTAPTRRGAPLSDRYLSGLSLRQAGKPFDASPGTAYRLIGSGEMGASGSELNNPRMGHGDPA